MKSRQMGWVVLPVLLLAAAGTAAGQSLVGTVMGQITVEGEPREGLTVVFQSLETDQKCEATTDEDGRYSCRVTAGPHEMRIIIEGSVVYKQEVQVRGGFRGDPESAGFANEFDVPLVRDKKSEEEQKRREEARKKFEERKARFGRAIELNEEGKYQEAIPILEQLVEEDPTQWAFFAQLGQAYSRADRLEEAAVAYEEAMSLNPTDAGLHVNLGTVYAKLGQVEAARQEFEMAAEMDPRNAGAAYFNLGVIFYNNRNMEAAIEPLRKATEKDPDRALAYYLLGVCLYNNAEIKVENGQTKTVLLPGTRESFQRYLELAPNGRFADDVKAMLQAIQGDASR